MLPPGRREQIWCCRRWGYEQIFHSARSVLTHCLEILARRWDHQPGATSEALLAITPEIANSRPVALTRWLAPLVYSRTTVV